MLRHNGEFLLRTAEPVAGQERKVVLSVMFDQEKEVLGIKHFVINRTNNGKFRIEKYGFSTITEMIEYHMNKKESVSKANDVQLRSAVPRAAWELDHEDVEATKKLGEGAYGEVHKGTLRLKDGRKVDVAIKMAKLESLTMQQIKEVMREARLMRCFDHPNVVKFYGVAAGQEPLMVVMELASNGALDSFLKLADVPLEKKLEMCLHASLGLEHMHKKEVLHRDIAARNCLYGDGKVKISDFGLSREGLTYQMDPHRRVPIRWLSPETLRTAFYSQKSDVFSFGILCWEIYNNGQEPYPGMTVAEVNVKVKEGYRMPFLPAVPQEVKSLVEKRCWSDNVNDRYTMEKVAKELDRISKLPRPPAPGMCGLMFDRFKNIRITSQDKDSPMGASHPHQGSAHKAYQNLDSVMNPMPKLPPMSPKPVSSPDPKANMTNPREKKGDPSLPRRKNHA